MKKMHSIVTGIAGFLALLATPVQAEQWHTPGKLQINFNNCTEFAGVAPVDFNQARALVPDQYQLISDSSGAKLVVRVSDCQSVSVNHKPGTPGRVAHIGIMVVSPDGTATDPNTSINNYTLSYASNLASLVESLNSYGIPAVQDNKLTYEYSPLQGPSQLYAAVLPSEETAADWFLTGTVTTPTIPSPFLANWWFESTRGSVKMTTQFPLIYFDFSSKVSFYTSRHNLIGELIQGNVIENFPLSFRGQYPKAQMVVSILP